jgi:hypothetical protein
MLEPPTHRLFTKALWLLVPGPIPAVIEARYADSAGDRGLQWGDNP